MRLPFNSRHAACGFATVFFSSMAVDAQGVPSAVSLRHAQVPQGAVENRATQPPVINPASLDQGHGVPPVSLNALIDDGQFLALPAARQAGDAGQGPLTLTAAIQRAIASYPDVQRAHERVNEQVQRVEVARAGYFPRISGGVRSGYRSDAPGGSSAQVFDLSASQMLYDFGKVSSLVKASEAGVLERQSEVGLSIEQVALDTSLAFLDSQFYQRLIVTAREQIESLEKVSELARQRFEMGASTRSDHIQTTSRIEAARATELQHQANLARSLATLTNLTGHTALADVVADFPEWLEQSCLRVGEGTQDNPGVIAAQAQVQRARAEVRAAGAAAWPTLSVEPTFSQHLAGDPGVHQDRSRYSVFLNASMPIYQGGAIQAGKAASERALASAQAGLDTARLKARQGLQQARSQAITLRSSLAAHSLRERAIDETRALYRQQYLELGTRPLLDLLNAEQEAYLARIERHSTLNDVRRLQLHCLYSVGHLSRTLGGHAGAYRERLP